MPRSIAFQWWAFATLDILRAGSASKILFLFSGSSVKQITAACSKMKLHRSSGARYSSMLSTEYFSNKLCIRDALVVASH